MSRKSIKDKKYPFIDYFGMMHFKGVSVQTPSLSLLLDNYDYRREELLKMKKDRAKKKIRRSKRRKQERHAQR